ncbi:FkbM family methyltransferase [Carboxylicivirga sp. RSCT41]|uniref:FkbM family methyltransferase n=1 Tax=Carboxylicivirga agarovorans TaxID=3417570 RepID=UPI003D340F4E
MNSLKRTFKRNTNNYFFSKLAGFGRALNRLYENRNYDPYSNGELVVIKKLSGLKPGVIIDGGANVGKYSLLLTQYNPQCNIYAFEPVLSTFNELKERVKDHSNIHPIHKGLFSEECTKQINIYGSSTLSTIYGNDNEKKKPAKVENIELVNGSAYMQSLNITEIDFLKLDLEGAEYDAIRGFEDYLKAGKIKALQFEYGQINIHTKKLLIDYYQLLEDYGYVLGKIFPKKVEFRKYEYKYEDFIGPNFIAVRKDDSELIKLLSKK